MGLFAPGDLRPIHFMGIAGAGMSALALVGRRRGVAITGCDLSPHGVHELGEAGVELRVGHDISHVVGARAIVYTAAVPVSHPELEAARAAGIPVVRRADALREAVAGGTVVAIAGTHGKTTITAMVTEALAAAGRDPTGIAGGRVTTWGANARVGGEDLYVVEADEYDRSFLTLEPTVAVVNNVEADHLECYGSLHALEAAFVEFASGARLALIGADDPGAGRVGAALSVPVWRVGRAPKAEIRLSAEAVGRAGSTAELRLPDGRNVALRLRVPGAHNVGNAAMAVGVVAALHGDVDAALGRLATFEGVERRFQVLGTARQVTVVDDYAHHPTEVAATLAAGRERFPDARLVAVFQPHLYSRTKALGHELGAALAAADLAVVTEIYPAREPAIPGVSGRLVADAAGAAGGQVEWVPELDQLAPRVAEVVREGDVVLMLGAGDITRIARELLDRLRGTA